MDKEYKKVFIIEVECCEDYRNIRYLTREISDSIKTLYQILKMNYPSLKFTITSKDK